MQFEGFYYTFGAIKAGDGFLHTYGIQSWARGANFTWTWNVKIERNQWNKSHVKNRLIWLTFRATLPKATQKLLNWPPALLHPPWVSCVLIAPKSLKWRRFHKSEGWPGRPSSSYCPGPQECPLGLRQRSPQRIRHVGLLETRRCCSESCWWTAASTSRSVASHWPTRPGTVHCSESRVAKMTWSLSWSQGVDVILSAELTNLQAHHEEEKLYLLNSLKTTMDIHS